MFKTPKEIFNGGCFLGVFESSAMTDDFFRNRLDQMIDLRHPLAPEFDTKRCKSLISLEAASKFPLQQAQLGVWCGLSDVHGRQQFGLLAVDVGDAADRHPLVD